MNVYPPPDTHTLSHPLLMEPVKISGQAQACLQEISLAKSLLSVVGTKKGNCWSSLLSPVKSTNVKNVLFIFLETL